MGKRRHVASGRLYRGCPWLRLGPQEARAAPPPASCLELFRRGRAALRQAAAALPHTWCACRAAFRQRVPVKHAADRRLRGRRVIGLPARARHDERRAPPWPVRSRAYHLNCGFPDGFVRSMLTNSVTGNRVIIVCLNQNTFTARRAL